MSVQQLEPTTETSADEALASHIKVQGYLLQRVVAELWKSHLAAAARRVRTAAPEVADLVLGIHPAGGKFSVLEARDSTGQDVSARIRDAAERAISAVDPEALGPVIGTRIDIASAAAWWPGH